MKKLILFLLLPLISLGQFSGPGSDFVSDGEAGAGLVFLGTTENANEDLDKVQVNDTIVLGIKLTNWLSSTNSVTYAHIDFKYNKDAYTYIDETFMATEGNPQSTEFIQNGFNMSFSSTYEAYDLWNQWQSGNYTTDSDWSIVHLQTQVTSGDLADLDYYVKFRLKVQNAGETHDYTDNIMITMGRVADDVESKVYDPVYAYPNQDLSLEPGADIDVAGVTVSLDMGTNVDLTDFKVVPLIYNGNDTWNTLIEGETFWINMPSNGTVDITDYLTDTEGTYGVVFEYESPINKTNNTFKTFYEDVLTISDVQLALKELAQHDQGAINSGISKFNSDVAGSTFGGDNQLTSADTYALLAHVTGIQELYIDYDADGDIDADDANSQASFFFKIFDETVYNSTAASYEQNGISHNGSLVEIDVDFTNETSAQNFSYKGTWKGDVNLSHSAEVTNSVANSAKSIRSYGSTKKVVDTNLSSFNVTEQDDQVVATILLPNTTRLTAAQYRLTFDDTRLEFDTIETTSGSQSTNFVKQTDNNINVGSINMLDGRLEDTVYKIIFNKKQPLSGVAGLIVVTNTDGANTDAERVEIKIE